MGAFQYYKWLRQLPRIIRMTFLLQICAPLCFPSTALSEKANIFYGLGVIPVMDILSYDCCIIASILTFLRSRNQDATCYFECIPNHRLHLRIDSWKRKTLLLSNTSSNEVFDFNEGCSYTAFMTW